ncbi:unnamed protein product [Psylliodes chrysocephalus]|uniref:L-Fucosyltransferase n=1 Tax=Psylliodes chrysocephalus TaxID=3402493 RepID=A0A9P0DCS8_9CUCU|nr:unnamed protein product [Psylliodes chrysocephala]
MRIQRLQNLSLFLLKLTILIVLIIFFMQYTSLSLYQNEVNVAPKTYNNFEKEQSLCLSIPKTQQLSKKRNCPNSGIVTVKEGGRLGNHIWAYISVLLVAEETSMEPYVPSCIKSRLSTLFDNLNLPVIRDIYHCAINGTSKNQNIILPMHISKPELLAHRINYIKQVFSIKQKLLVQSQKKLHEGVKYLNSTFHTFVGVHARRTDYIAHLKIKFNVVPQVTNFFKSAMSYFENKYPKTIFIFVSDDPNWCFREFGAKKNVYVTGRGTKNSPELDVAIMASCNHSIIDYGTFGQWGALLAGGETVYYEISSKYSSDVLGKHLSIVTVKEGGRLGNQIWEYISVWLVAEETSKEPYVPSCIKSRLSTLFDNLNLPVIRDIYHCANKETSKNQNIILPNDDPNWCFGEFGAKKNVYVTGRGTKNSPELDVAIMASCNHSIIDYGTFGQWGALLAGGETVYYEISPKYSSDLLGKHLSNWHTIKLS